MSHKLYVVLAAIALAVGSNVLLTSNARAAAPMVTTLPASGVSNAVATLSGTVNPGGAATTAWFEWGVTANSQRTTNRAIGSGVVVSNLTHSLTGLTAGVAYYARVAASNSAGVVRGHEVVPGAPLLLLQGAGSLTNFLGEPYADAGASAGTGVLAVAGGFGHSLALRADGMIEGWGGYSVSDPPALSNIVALSSIQYSAMALRRDGSVFGWGDSTYGQTNIPPDVSNGVAIAAGDYTDAVLRNNGTVIVWGAGTFGGTNVPPDLSNVVAIAAGERHQLALRGDGTVAVWGINNFGQTNMPAGLTNIVAIAAGSHHSLALRSDGTVVAWGYNSGGQLNVPIGLNGVVALAGGVSNSIALRSDGTIVAWGSTRSTNVPPGLTGVVAIGSGYDHSLAVRSNGTVVAWGDNTLGKTNVPATAYRAPVVALSGSVNTAAPGTYVLTYSSTNSLGGISRVSRTVVIVAPPPPAVTTLPANHADNSSATLNGTVNPNGAVTTAYFQYGLTTSYGNFTATNSFVATNASFSLANILTNLPLNTIYHFRLVARNSGGVVNGADQTFTTLFNPPLVTTLPASGVANTMATLNGTVNPKGTAAATAWFEWGLAGSGQRTSNRAVGSGMATSNLSQMITGLALGMTYSGQMVASNRDWVVRGQPVRFGSPALALQGAAALTNIVNTPFVDPGLATNSNPVAIAAGAGHCLALRGDGAVVAWGANDFGQANVPAALTNAVAISAGGSHCLALRSDGTLAAWGSTFYQERVIPAGLSNVVAISAGNSLNVVLRSDGTVYAWADGIDGQTNIPPGLSNVVGVAAGQDNSMALRGDGTVAVWGKNNYGQTSVPLDVTNVVAIEAGVSHCLALRSDGTVAAWGYNSSGQGTVPPGLSNVVAISAGNYHNLALRSDGTVVAWGNPGAGVTNMPAGLSNIVAISAGTFNCMALSSDGTITVWGYLSPGQETAPASVFEPLPVVINGSVNSAVPGTYVLTYTRTNLLGGISTVSRTVVISALPPTVTVLPVTGVTKTMASLHGAVTLGGAITRAYFQYGLTTNYGSFSTTNILNLPGLEVAVSNLISSLVPLTTYHFRLVATNTAGVARSANFAFTTPGSGVAGDLNGDGVVSQSELNAVYANYVTNSPWLYMTNLAGLGGTNVSFALDNSVSAAYTVQYSTNLVNWYPLGPATPRYLFTDTNAPALPQRYYRLIYP